MHAYFRNETGEGESKSTFMLGCWKEYITAAIDIIREMDERDTVIVSLKLLM